MNYQRNSSCRCDSTCNIRTPFDRRSACRMPCSEERRPACIDGRSLAMVYSPCQRFNNLYESSEGLCRGTMFRELDKPFTGRKCL